MVLIEVTELMEVPPTHHHPAHVHGEGGGEGGGHTRAGGALGGVGGERGTGCSRRIGGGGGTKESNMCHYFYNLVSFRRFC